MGQRAGGVTENDKNNSSNFAVRLFVRGLNSSPSWFSPSQFLSDTKTKYLKRVLESFFFIFSDVFSLLQLYFFSLVIYLFF